MKRRNAITCFVKIYVEKAPEVREEAEKNQDVERERNKRKGTGNKVRRDRGTQLHRTL